MAKKALDTLTESMLYVLISFHKGDMSGTEIAAYVKDLTHQRVRIGPGTLYTILSNFQSEGLIEKKEPDGRRIVYAITQKGTQIYNIEIQRLKQCLKDAGEGE